MLPKAYLTLHSRMSGSRWVITPLWLSGSWRSFLYSSSVYSCHLFLTSASLYVYTISVLYRAHLCMKCSLGISNFLEEISSLSHSVLFLYFFALITEEGFLISHCCSFELCNLISLISHFWDFSRGLLKNLKVSLRAKRLYPEFDFGKYVKDIKRF